jgi:hypothetical protein
MRKTQREEPKAKRVRVPTGRCSARGYEHTPQECKDANHCMSIWHDIAREDPNAACSTPQGRKRKCGNCKDIEKIQNWEHPCFQLVSPGDGRFICRECKQATGGDGNKEGSSSQSSKSSKSSSSSSKAKKEMKEEAEEEEEEEEEGEQQEEEEQEEEEEAERMEVEEEGRDGKGREGSEGAGSSSRRGKGKGKGKGKGGGGKRKARGLEADWVVGREWVAGKHANGALDMNSGTRVAYKQGLVAGQLLQLVLFVYQVTYFATIEFTGAVYKASSWLSHKRARPEWVSDTTQQRPLPSGMQEKQKGIIEQQATSRQRWQWLAAGFWRLAWLALPCRSSS